MKIIEPGHIYELAQQDYPIWTVEDEKAARAHVCPEGAPVRLKFVNREPGHHHPGTQTQEVLRALIDRTYHCDSYMPHELNAMIIHHLRMALVYHEMQALERKAEKGLYRPEDVVVGVDGHFALTSDLPTKVHRYPAPRREFQLQVPQKECKYREY